jgi:CDP-glycerol glycerophosphotransferase
MARSAREAIQMAPRLSVIVPYYGVEEYIADCLASLRAQTFTDFEVILVDDGSLDRSREIAEAHVAADDRFRIITQPNAGLAAARNTGTGQATGEYLMFVDSDDLVAPRAFQQFVTTLDRTGSDFAGARVWRLNAKGALYRSFAHEETFSERVDGTTIVHHPLLMRDRMVWNKVYRRSFWDDRGYRFPELWFEDFPITLRAHLEARAVDLLPDPVYVWRERPTGTSISQ